MDEEQRIDLSTLTRSERRGLNDCILRVLLILTADDHHNRDTFTISRYSYFESDSPVKSLVDEHLLEKDIVTDGYSIYHRQHTASIVSRTLLALRRRDTIFGTEHWEINNAAHIASRIIGKKLIKDQVKRVALRHILAAARDDLFNINKASNSAALDESMLSVVDLIPSYVDRRSDVARHTFAYRLAQDGMRALQALGIIRATDNGPIHRIHSILDAMAHTFADDGDLTIEIPK